MKNLLSKRSLLVQGFSSSKILRGKYCKNLIAEFHTRKEYQLWRLQIMNFLTLGLAQCKFWVGWGWLGYIEIYAKFGLNLR